MEEEHEHEMLNALSNEVKVDSCELSYPLDVVDAIDVSAGLRK
jgi:hypothetical protein